jgi:hypothetical protein
LDTPVSCLTNRMEKDRLPGLELTIRDEPTNERADHVWREFAAVTAGYVEAEMPNPTAIARMINIRDNPMLSTADLFRQIGELATSAAGPEPGHNPSRLSAVLAEIDLQFFAESVKSQTNISHRKQVLHAISKAATPQAIVRTVEAAAYSYGHPFSEVMKGLLTKLAREAVELREPLRAAADQSYRDLFRHMVNTWSAGSITIEATTFDSFFSNDPGQSTLDGSGSVTPEADRVLQVAFETGAVGNLLWNTIAKISADAAGERRVLEMLKDAPADSRAARVVGDQFANPARLARLLTEEPVDFQTVDTLLAFMKATATSTLVDAVAESKSRATRRGVLDRLASLGADVGPLVTNRLFDDKRWYVQRNMLTVLREAKCGFDASAVEPYTRHDDPRVRREAVQLLLTDPVRREKALIGALRDNDPNMLKVGLKEARNSMPESIVPLLAKRVVEPDFPAQFRTAALQLLARSNSVLALEALLRFVVGAKTLLGKHKLAPKSPEMLMALGGLARAWPNERRVTPLLQTARESKDPDIIAAANASPRGPSTTTTEKDPLEDE